MSWNHSIYSKVTVLDSFFFVFSCYMNSVLQVLFTLPEFNQRYIVTLLILAINTLKPVLRPHIKQTPSTKWTPTWVSTFSFHIYCKINLRPATCDVDTNIKPSCCTKPDIRGHFKCLFTCNCSAQTVRLFIKRTLVSVLRVSI